MATCKECGQRIPSMNIRVRVYGMYDMHMFAHYEGATVDEVIHKWRNHDDPKYGPTSLCPVIVSATNVVTGKRIELRRVGPMVHRDSKYAKEPKMEELLALWRSAVLKDPDISRVLARQAAEVA